mmetsp:Transcript_58754/g.108431  ORF Transcript_58754/g.108431 Transcript_58754/m.108431 type:complete len:157 (-) Transcript_58754:71-541(-)
MRRSSSRSKYLVGVSLVRGSAPSGDSAGAEVGKETQRMLELPKRLCPLGVGSFHVQLRSHWPDLDITARDAEVYEAFCYNILESSAQALLDASCPFKYLSPRSSSYRPEEVRDSLAENWSFRDLMQEADYPDDRGFVDWCQLMQDRQSKRCQEAQR